MSLALWQRRLRTLLAPAGFLWSTAMLARRRLFEDDRLLRHVSSQPVVSVGNIRMGGSGKTPLTLWLLGWALKKGLKPVTLTRGYRATPPQRPYLVGPESRPQDAGDEPLMLAQAQPGAAVLVDPVRTRAAIWAEKHLSPDLFILDDGFQHLAVSRQVDLVLLTPQDLDQDWNRVFPAGMWREGKSALASATAFLVKADAEEFQKLTPKLKKLPQRPVFPMHLAPTGLADADGNRVADLENRPYLLISGVADPQGVLRSAIRLLGPPAGTLFLSDHAAFDSGQRREILDLAEALGAMDLVCTAKDAVKLRPHGLEIWPRKLWLLETELAFGPALGYAGDFVHYWDTLWSELQK